MKVVVTLPAYNEEKTIGGVLDTITDVLKKTGWEYQILVVNDGSKDKTVKVAEKHGAIVFSHPRNRGLAQTFHTEMEQCLKHGADIIVHTDADGQYDAHAIPELVKKVQEGYDLVLGSRFLGRPMKHMPFMKRVGNKAFSCVFTQLLHQKITDSTTGFRAFTAEVAQDITFINTFTYTQEQLIRAKKQGFRIAEVSIKSRATRESRLFKGPIQYAIKAWINIFRIYRDYEPLKFFGLCGGALIFLGCIGGIIILYSLLTTFKGAGGIPRVILTASLFLSGIQIILFGFLADMLKKS